VMSFRLMFSFLLVIAVCMTVNARAQAEPPKDEVHADIRKDVAEPEKKPDPRESKVPGEEAHKTSADKDAKSDQADKKDGDKSVGKDKKDEKDADRPVVTHGK